MREFRRKQGKTLTSALPHPGAADPGNPRRKRPILPIGAALWQAGLTPLRLGGNGVSISGALY
jgi:hypothetical protein